MVAVFGPSSMKTQKYENAKCTALSKHTLWYYKRTQGMYTSYIEE